MRIGDVWLIYFGQVVSFCAIIYPNKNSLNSCMPECGKFQRIGNIFAIILKKFTRAKIYFNQMTFVTNSTSECECIRQRESWQCCPVSHRDCQSFLNQGQEFSQFVINGLHIFTHKMVYTFSQIHKWIIGTAFCNLWCWYMCNFDCRRRPKYVSICIWTSTFALLSISDTDNYSENSQPQFIKNKLVLLTRVCIKW